MTPSPNVVIAGGGASGLLLASAVVRAGRSVTIVEPRERLGAGIAYSTTCPLHLLNVPSANMSAIGDDPAHFVRWLEANGENIDGAGFVQRSTYGRYLASIADELKATADARFRHVQTTADDCALTDSGVLVTCANGETIAADAFVVAVGNAEPSPWPRIENATLASGRYFSSAWAPGAIVPAAVDETVVLLGTGLTAIDATLGLRHNGHRGPIVMVSRRGLLPHEHRIFDSPPAIAPDALTVRDLIGSMRLAARTPGSARGWRGAVDALRSQTNAHWRSWTLDDKRRFVRHVLPYWNVHRHRLAPEAAKLIAELIAANTLRMVAGRTEEIRVTPDALHVPIRLRGTSETLVVDAARVINCSGPQNDFTQLPNPLIRRLIERGYLVPHALQIGANVAPDGALASRIYAIGPVRFGTLIETTAIPEIREQAYDLALTLAGISVPSVAPGTR